MEFTDKIQVFGIIAPWLCDSPKDRFKLLNLYIQLFISNKKESQNNDITLDYLDAIRNTYKFQQDNQLQILQSNEYKSIIHKIRIIKNKEKQLLFMKYNTEDWDKIWHKAILDGNVDDYEFIGFFHELKEIKDEQFMKCNLTSVVIPESVKFIGYKAFRRNKLTSVIIPDSVKSIGKYAFGNNYLGEITIPDSVESIGEGAFIDNQLTSVIIPDSVEIIRKYAFSSNELESVIIPDSVEIIGESVFELNNLTHIEIPDSVKSIGDSAFKENKLTSVTIPDSVEIIGLNAFYKNNLTSVEIPIHTDVHANAFDHGVQIIRKSA